VVEELDAERLPRPPVHDPPEDELDQSAPLVGRCRIVEQAQVRDGPRGALRVDLRAPKLGELLADLARFELDELPVGGKPLQLFAHDGEPIHAARLEYGHEVVDLLSELPFPLGKCAFLMPEGTESLILGAVGHFHRGGDALGMRGEFLEQSFHLALDPLRVDLLGRAR
jgi:hypothetical protein